jgi:hypothetical protein
MCFICECIFQFGQVSFNSLTHPLAFHLPTQSSVDAEYKALQRQEKARTMETIDALDRFPKVMKVRMELSRIPYMLYTHDS